MAKKKSETQSKTLVAYNRTPVSIPGSKNNNNLVDTKPGMTFRVIRALRDTNTLVNLCIETLKHTVVKIPFKIVVKEGSGKEIKQYKNEVQYLETLFKKPNDLDNYRSFWLKVIEDVLTIDRGVIEKTRSANGYFAKFYPVDGSTILPLFDDKGQLMTPAYVQLIDTWMPVAEFESEDIDVIMNSPVSQIGMNGYGKSPVERIIQDVVTYIQSQNYNSKTFTDSNLPPAVVNLKMDGSSPRAQETMESFKAAWESAVNGNPFKAIFTNVDGMEVKELRGSNQDMQYYELMLWLARTTVAAFEMSPQDLGLTMDVNKATGEVQQNISKNQGIKNLLNLMQLWHQEVIDDLALIDDRYKVLCFEYMDIDKLDEKTEAEIEKMKAETAAIYLGMGVDPNDPEQIKEAQEVRVPEEKAGDETKSAEEVEDDREEANKGA